MKPINQLTAADVVELIKKVPRKVWIIAGGGLFAAAIFVYLIVIPAWFMRPQVKREISGIQMQMATTQNLLLKQPELIKNKTNFLKLSEEVKKRLYKPGESSLLLGVISKLAQESNVSVVASNPKPFEGKFPAPFDAQYEANAYTFTVEGGYHDLATFVSKIESHEKVLRVQVFTILPQDKLPGKHLAELSLTAVSTKTAVPPAGGANA